MPVEERPSKLIYKHLAGHAGHALSSAAGFKVDTMRARVATQAKMLVWLEAVARGFVVIVIHGDNTEMPFASNR